MSHAAGAGKEHELAKIGHRVLFGTQVNPVGFTAIRDDGVTKYPEFAGWRENAKAFVAKTIDVRCK